jgi:hypothetical protein
MKTRQCYIKRNLLVSFLLTRNLILRVTYMQLQFTAYLCRVMYFGALVCCLVTVWVRLLQIFSCSFNSVAAM